MFLLFAFNIIRLARQKDNNFFEFRRRNYEKREDSGSGEADGVYLWEIAERFGCNDGNFSRKLRRELPADEQRRILVIISELAAEKKGAIR